MSITLVPYNYLITATANNKVVEGVLKSEIRASDIKVAVADVAVGVVNTLTITISFKASLDTTDEALLTTIVGAHEGIPKEEEEASHVQVDSGFIYLKEFGSLKHGENRPRFKTYIIDGLNGDSITTEKIQFPHPVSFAYVEILGENVVTGDYGYAWAQTREVTSPSFIPAGVMAQARAAQTTGNNSVDVSTIPKKLIYGDVVKFHTDNTEYFVQSHIVVDETTDRLTLTENLNADIPLGGLVYWKGLFCDGIFLIQDKQIDFGRGTFGSSTLTTGLELVIEYHHKNTLTADKEIPLLLGYYYGNLETS